MTDTDYIKQDPVCDYSRDKRTGNVLYRPADSRIVNLRTNFEYEYECMQKILRGAYSIIRLYL